MSPLTKNHLAELREELEGQLVRLMRSIEASEAALERIGDSLRTAVDIPGGGRVRELPLIPVAEPSD